MRLSVGETVGSLVGLSVSTLVGRGLSHGGSSHEHTQLQLRLCANVGAVGEFVGKKVGRDVGLLVG